jgi:hypothetical protein
VSINGAVLLILDVALGGVLPFIISGALLLWFVVIWYVVPLTARQRSRS